MFNGKMKALTFSYDDGVTQDKRLIEIFDRYGMKATFNINSELLGKQGELRYGEKAVCHNKVQPDEVRELYRNHEVAVHTLTHPNLANIDDADEIFRQVEADRQNLTNLTGRETIGMAYPGGGVNSSRFAADIIKNKTGVRFARTTVPTYNFELQDDLYLFNPTLHHRETERLFELGREFLELEPESPKLFYVWGHSYEFDFDNSWELIEEFCRMMSGRDDIFYGTNSQTLLGE